MILAPLEMSVPAGDGLILKGTLTYPRKSSGAGFPLAVLAHQYPSTRDSYSPLVADLADRGAATLAFDQRGHGAPIVSAAGPKVIDTPEGLTLEAFGKAFTSSLLASSRDDPFAGGENAGNWSRGLSHVTGRIVPGSAHAMAIYFDIRDELLQFLDQSLARQ